MIIKVEVKEEFLKGDSNRAKGLGKRMVDALQSEILVRPEIDFVSMGSIPVPEVGKAKRVIDHRTL
jgi:phenylacetate-coenzyme A ligase PaaK-like adenylate-forming protein